jgi:hypothetical protein
LKARSLAGHQRLMLIILATQEAEIGRIVVQSQTPANNLQDLTSKNKNKTQKGWQSGSSSKSACLASVVPDFKPQCCQYVYTHTHTHTHTYIYTFIHTHIYTYVHTHIYVYEFKILGNLNVPRGKI